MGVYGEMGFLMNEFANVVKNVVEFYFKLALENYPKLSSFAIVTDENFSTFAIAINEDKFFTDVESKILSDEDYWNPAEWTEESFSSKHKNEDKKIIFQFLEDNKLKDSDILYAFQKSLLSLRKEDNKNICMFIHITDFEYSKSLNDIVKLLNGENLSQHYKKYFLD